MKILFITPTLPTRISRIRAYNILKVLSKSHDVHLLSFIDSEIKKKKIGEIKEFCRSIDTVYLPKYKSFFNCILYLFTGVPLRVAYYKSKRMKEKIEKLLAKEKFDVVYIKRKRIGQYGRYIKSIPKILDLTDAVSMYHLRASKYVNFLKKIYYLIEGYRLLKYEIKITKEFDKVVLSSSIDAEFLQKNSKEELKNLAVIPNVVDTEYYKPKGFKIEENSLLFSGIMENLVNIDSAIYFCREIYPLILKEIPDTKLYIVGPEPPSSIRGLSQFSGYPASGYPTELGGGKNGYPFLGGVPVVVTGYVNDLRDYIEKSEVIICPIRIGAGTRNKILQAFALGKPVVSTSLGAEGIEVVDNENILIADTQDVFAKKVIHLLRDKKLQEKLIKNSFKFVTAKYSLDILKNKLDGLFKEIKN